MNRSEAVSTEVHAAWADLAEVPSGDGWLTAAEAEVHAGFRFAKRRGDWRVGRWAAKRAVAAYLGGMDVGGIEILAAEDGAPLVRLPGGDSGPVALSLSHSHGRGFAVATSDTEALGCDLEAVAPRTSAFIQDYLTELERDFVLAFEGAPRDEAANLVWCAKEAALKALRQGLRLDPRGVEVRFEDYPQDDGGWTRLAVNGTGTERFSGWWRMLGGFAWAIVVRGSGRPSVVEHRPAPAGAD